MQFHQVCLESIGYVLPGKVVSSANIEKDLAPLYRRLRLPEGRLELISGVRERRVWNDGGLPSDHSVQSATLAIQAADWDRTRIGALVHGSVCRDHLEPATACHVHGRLELPAQCAVYDVSNACLGILNGLLQIASMIELDQIEAGIVVGSEDSGPLVEATIQYLNGRDDLTRESIKSSLASLTIGSASAAFLLVHRRHSRSNSLVTSAIAHANTRHNQLCQSGRDDAVAAGMQPLMHTDSEAQLQEGIATGADAFQRFMTESGWTANEIDRTVCHQVGTAHRRRMLESLGLPLAHDFATVETLGNTGSAALPITLALAAESNFLPGRCRLALLGIGSGINSVMVGIDWRGARVQGLDQLVR